MISSFGWPKLEANVQWNLYSRDKSIQGTQSLVPQKCSRRKGHFYSRKGAFFLGPKTLVSPPLGEHLSAQNVTDYKDG